MTKAFHIRLAALPRYVLTLSLVLAAPLSLRAQTTPAARPTIDITGYTIDAELDPAAHTLQATARVSFTALDAVDTANFELHSALRVSRVTDAHGKPLSAERAANSTLRVTPPAPLAKGDTAVYTFTYQGTLSGTEPGPVEGLKLATVADPISYLLYPGAWFPMTGYLTDRFTADITVRVPNGYRVIASGQAGAPHPAGPRSAAV